MLLVLFKKIKVVEASDIIIEVLDARDPLGCRCPQVEEAVLTSGKNKKLILLLNKIGRMNSFDAILDLRTGGHLIRSYST